MSATPVCASALNHSNTFEDLKRKEGNSHRDDIWKEFTKTRGGDGVEAKLSSNLTKWCAILVLKGFEARVKWSKSALLRTAAARRAALSAAASFPKPVKSTLIRNQEMQQNYLKTDWVLPCPQKVPTLALDLQGNVVGMTPLELGTPCARRRFGPSHGAWRERMPNGAWEISTSQTTSPRLTPSTSDTWHHEKIQTKAHDHLGLAWCSSSRYMFIYSIILTSYIIP